MFTTVAYYESQDGGGAYHNVAAVQDDHIKAVGDYIYVAQGMDNLIGHAALSAATTFSAARMQSPSLNRVCSIYIGVFINAVVFGNPPESIMHPFSPTPLAVAEGLRFQINSDNDGAAVEYGLVWFGDGPQQQVQGDIYTIYATAAITLSAGMWVNGNLTFAEDLSVGTYQIVGLRVVGTNLVAARLNFPGMPWRPGVPAPNSVGDLDCSWFRYGRMGVFGEFHSTVPPTLEALGVTDSSQKVWIDLIKTS